MFSRKKIAMLVAEFIGTGILTFVILSVSRSAIGIPYFVAIAAGITLALSVLTIGATSGSHINPAVTFGLWSIRKISTLEAVAYFAAQFLGAAVAWRLFTYFINDTLPNIAGAEFDWRIFVAEAVGTLVFTFGIAAAIYQKYEGGRLATAIGGSLLVGVLIASVISNGLLNPAVALGVQSWSVTYVVAPLVGSVIGMNLYALLFAGEKLVPVKAVAKSATVTKTTAKKKTTRKKK